MKLARNHSAMAVEHSAMAVELRKLAERGRRLALGLASGEDQSRLLSYVDELEARALRIEAAPTSDTSH
jgi:hypothetical protein